MCMKKLALFFTLILTLFLFTGCASSNVLVKENLDGSVDIFYSVQLEVSKLLEDEDITESDVNQMKSKIETKASELIARCRAEYNFNLNKYYSNGAITKEERNKLVKEFNVYTGWNSNLYLVKFSFDSAKSYKIYVDYGTNLNINTQTEKGFFVNKNIQKSINPLGRKRNELGGESIFKYFNDLKNDYINSHFSAEVAEKFPKLVMSYSYVTPTSKIHSDADEKDFTNVGYLHSWEINENNYTKEIEFYTLSVNPATWYLLALTIVFVFMAIYLVVIYFKKPKNKINSGFDI